MPENVPGLLAEETCLNFALVARLVVVVVGGETARLTCVTRPMALWGKESVGLTDVTRPFALLGKKLLG